MEPVEIFFGGGLLLALSPCLFTSNGCDYSWFYNSLFIDALLGILCGYLFYFAVKKPFNSRFKTVSFLVSAAFAVTLKDSAITFAVVSVLCALVLRFIKDKQKSRKKYFVKTVVSLLCVLLPYAIWEITLGIYGVSNHLSMGNSCFNSEALGNWFKKFTESACVDLRFENDNALYFTLFVAVVLLIVAYCFINRKYGCTDKLETTVMFLGIAVAFILFTVGYLSIFYLEMPSFARYYSTIVYIIYIFVILNFIEKFIVADNLKCADLKNFSKIIPSVILSVVILICGCKFFKIWDNCRYKNDYVINSAAVYADCINVQIPIEEHKDTKIYLCMTNSDSLLHHRIYYNLIGSNIKVGNFYNDVSPEAPNENCAWQWLNRVYNDGYDYLYIINPTYETNYAFELFGLEPPKEGEVYKISAENGVVHLLKLNS